MKFSVILVVLQVCWCLKVGGSDPPPKSALDFMKQYGYLKADKTTSAALYTEDGLSEVIKTVQRFGALEETGKLDNETLKLMRTPRCGNADIIQKRRSKRFILTSGWNKRHITYYVANWSSRLGEQVVARLIGKALNTWGSYANLKFSRAANPDADIIVSFARGAHNDPFPFDGPGYVLAHAYFPNSGSAISGDIHFDDDENWVHDNPQAVEDGGTDFYSVALHELGHSLGLGHSNDPRSVMFPYYQGGDETTLRLGQDDILAMYQLYIARTIQETTVTTTTERTRRTRPHNEIPRTRSPYETTRKRFTEEYPSTRSPNEPSRTRASYETPRTRPSQTSIWTSTYQPSSSRSQTERISTKIWESSTSSMLTETPTRRITKTDRTSMYPSTRARTTYVPYGETRTTLTTHSPPTLYPKRNEDGTTYSRWFTSSPPHWKDYTYKIRTSTMNTRHYPTEISTERNRNIHGTSVKMSKKPYYSSPRYPIGSQSSTPPPEPNICEGTFDSVAYLRGEIFIFKNEYIWRLHDRNRVVSGYPVLLKQMFPYLPENIKKIDAAYQRPDGNMILFTGDLYWVYDGKQFIENSPQPILNYGIPLGIGGIDAVQTWTRNGMTYLFKEDRFWRFNETSKTPDEGYPQLMNKWRGVPRNLDAAMTWKDGRTYFFKDDLYWILDNHRVEVTSDSPRYATREWLRCP